MTDSAVAANGVAYEVYGNITELSVLARLGKLSKVQLSRAHVLMGRLRDSGFVPSEISLLVGGRWKTDAIWKYGVWSGVADVSRRDSVIGVLSGMVAKGYKLEDVEEFKAAKEQLDKASMSFSDSIIISSATFTAKASVQELVNFSKEINLRGKTLKALSERIDLEFELNKCGINRSFQERLAVEAKKHENLDEYLKMIDFYPKLVTMTDKESKLRADVEVLEVKLSELERMVAANQEKIDLVKDLGDLGWTGDWLLMLRVVAGSLGNPKEVIDYLNASEKWKKSLKAKRRGDHVSLRPEEFPTFLGEKDMEKIPSVAPLPANEYLALVILYLRSLSKAVTERKDLNPSVKTAFISSMSKMVNDLDKAQKSPFW